MYKKQYFKKLMSIVLGTLMISSFSIHAEQVKTSNESNNANNVEWIDAKWQEQETRFTYFGYTTYYTCDGIESSVESLLTELGAKDVKARASGCYNFNSAERSLSVRVKFKTLSTDESLRGEPIKVQMQDLHFNQRSVRRSNHYSCDLIDDIQKKVLDNFEHEVIKKQGICGNSPSRVDWRVKVLKPVSE